MYLCYIDESGTSDIPGTSSHFVLAGLSIPIWKWKYCEKRINTIKKKYKLEGAEIHTSWILRPYAEQSTIEGFESKKYSERRTAIEKYRSKRIYELQREGNTKKLQKRKKYYRATKEYIHLNRDERKKFIKSVAEEIGSWGFARLFGESIDKVFFNPEIGLQSIDEQAFEQVVSRFEHYLRIVSSSEKPKGENFFGLLIHDNNQTIAQKHTNLMKEFHENGTLWTKVKCIIETPLFVDSSLTSMIQLSDLCAYSIRRYLENDEEELFKHIYPRFDRKHENIVGIRHFTENSCNCLICEEHSKIK